MCYLTKGYDYILDEKTNTVLAVSRTTGETTEAVLQYLPRGTISYTPESQEEYKQRKEREQKRALRRMANLPLGHFYFLSMLEEFKDVSPETAIHLVYLNTFMSYHSNKLMLTERTPMRRANLPKVLSVSKATASRFWHEVSPEYIIETTNGEIYADKNIFAKGNIDFKDKSETDFYTKVHIDGVRKLYRTVEKSSLKYLGYIFKLLPFINLEYNVLCRNPSETEIEKIELITIDEFCSLIGYDVDKLGKLLTIYGNIRFDVNGRKERFCSLVYDGIDKLRSRVCINPHIIYSGNNYERVKVFGLFYR